MQKLLYSSFEQLESESMVPEVEVIDKWIGFIPPWLIWSECGIVRVPTTKMYYEWDAIDFNLILVSQFRVTWKTGNFKVQKQPRMRLTHQNEPVLLRLLPEAPHPLPREEVCSILSATHLKGSEYYTWALVSESWFPSETSWIMTSVSLLK